MVECGICGSSQKQLYCGGCATHLTLRARVNVIKVTRQVSLLQANIAEALDGGTAAGTLAEANNNEGNEVRTEQLHAKIAFLQQRLDRIQTAVVLTHDKTQGLRQQSQLLKTRTEEARKELETTSRDSRAQFDARATARTSKEGLLQKGYRDMLHLSMSLQSKCCQDLLEIFSLKKKRKKGGYEFVLGFNVVPELVQLGHYSVTTINSGLERVATFVVLLSSYLALRLPYEIGLPRKAQPKVLLGTLQEPLWLPHSVKTMMRSSPREFHNYCRLLSMLAINVSLVGLKLGIPSVNDLQDIAKLNQLIAQIYLRIESLIKSGHQIQVYSGTVAADLESLQDYLITAIDIELNGRSAEWNIVEAP